MTPLIDFDIFLHEIGWSCQFKHPETKEDVLFDFDRAIEFLEDKLRIICYEVEATEEPILFLSDSQELTNKINRTNRLFQEEARVFIPNFRYEIAKAKGYKGNRSQPKPFHFYNLQTYARGQYKHIISEGGLEADDELGIFQTTALKEGRETVICSRDKDLRMVPGNHYTWECGKQQSLGPEYTDELGRLALDHKGKVYGYGYLFFCYQLLAGDTVDNIPGLKGFGPVISYKEVKDQPSKDRAILRVRQLYQEKLGSEWEEHFVEQAKLLWIKQERSDYYGYPLS